MPSSDCGNMPVYDVPIALATSLGCTTFDTPLQSPPDGVVSPESRRATAGVSPLRIPWACPPEAHATLPDSDAGIASAGWRTLRTVRPRGGRPWVTLLCWAHGFAGS